jgi:hypothetical protein
MFDVRFNACAVKAHGPGAPGNAGKARHTWHRAANRVRRQISVPMNRARSASRDNLLLRRLVRTTAAPVGSRRTVASLLRPSSCVAGHASLASGLTCLLGCPFVGSPFLMRRLATLAGDLFLPVSVHRGKSAIFFTHIDLLAVVGCVHRSRAGEHAFALWAVWLQRMCHHRWGDRS